MSPKAFVTNGVETRQVFGFDAPFVSDSRTQVPVALSNGTTHRETGFHQQQTVPTSHGSDVPQGMSGTSHKAKRKSSPPINTPLNLKRHWPLSLALLFPINCKHHSLPVYLWNNIIFKTRVFFFFSRVLFLLLCRARRILIDLHILFIYLFL